MGGLDRATELPRDAGTRIIRYDHQASHTTSADAVLNSHEMPHAQSHNGKAQAYISDVISASSGEGIFYPAETLQKANSAPDRAGQIFSSLGRENGNNEIMNQIIHKM
ncbi:hypothetical protein [Azorhizobium caulinodans]|uniref:hypothetical protein n=1 Tax=Azorhizobium caulinodans TaxID=7 RepID=UPI002FBD84AC